MGHQRPNNNFNRSDLNQRLKDLRQWRYQAAVRAAKLERTIDRIKADLPIRPLPGEDPIQAPNFGHEPEPEHLSDEQLLDELTRVNSQCSELSATIKQMERRRDQLLISKGLM